VDPATGEVAVATAGHLPVLRVGLEGAALLATERGPALGLLEDADYREVRVTLSPGDRLLLYSDGLLERRGASLEEGFGALRAAAVEVRGTDPDTLVDAVLGALDPPDADDVTLLALGLAGAAHP
jgi:chemotaxis family two-component system sensor kinase Cph1